MRQISDLPEMKLVFWNRECPKLLVLHNHRDFSPITSLPKGHFNDTSLTKVQLKGLLEVSFFLLDEILIPNLAQ